MGDRIGWRRTITFVGSCGCAFTTLGLYYVPHIFGANYPLVVAAGMAYGIALAGFVPIAAIMAVLAPESKGAAMSIMNLGSGMSTLIGPAIAASFCPCLASPASSGSLRSCIWRLRSSAIRCVFPAFAHSDNLASAKSSSPAGLWDGDGSKRDRERRQMGYIGSQPKGQTEVPVIMGYIMKALVLEEKLRLSLRDIALPLKMGPRDVRIRIGRVGICGSDVHYYKHGRIGPFVVNAPMVLGHEAAGVVVAVGARCSDLAPGDRVCMEPGIPDMISRASREGHYNLDPAVRFWATPPIHGCLTAEVVHPAAFTFKLPAHVSLAEGAMVEPFAVGMHAATKARIKPGATAVVIGAGPIGIMVALSALAAGAGQVVVSDLSAEKLAIAGQYAGIVPFDIRSGSLAERVSRAHRRLGSGRCLRS